MSKKTEAVNTDKVRRTENYEFQYNFTKEELEHKSKQLAKACQDRDAIEDELKTIKASFKAKTESKTAEINLLSTHINNGHEYLFKSCIVEYDFDKGVKHYIYNDNVVGIEKMTQHDYQLQAELEEAQPEEMNQEEELQLKPHKQL